MAFHVIGLRRVRVLAQAPVFAMKHKKVALVTVIRTKGSTPRHAGTHMLVSATGELVGTIGGGRVEHEVIQWARQLADDEVAQVTHDLVHDLAMCCGGSMTFLAQPLVLCLGGIEELCQREAARGSSWFELDLRDGGLKVQTRLDSRVQDSKQVSERVFRGHVVPPPRVFLFGYGHLSRAIGPMAAALGFAVVLCDDNETLALDEAPPWASACVPSFVFHDIEKQAGTLGAQDYLLILTRDHGIDQKILEACLPHVDRLAYLGLIGSLGKIGRFKKRVLAKGVASDAQWAKLHGPMGLSIAAETPHEIAISILAELVQVKNLSQASVS